VRRHLRSLLGRYLPTVPVLSQAEVSPDIEVEAAGMVRVNAVQTEPATNTEPPLASGLSAQLA